MAAAIAAKHGAASPRGAVLRLVPAEKQLDGLMLDFYLIVSDYRAAYGKRWLAAANRLIPPNVFHFEHDGLAAKYAVLSEADFDRLNGPETRNVSVWARFAQPSRLVWAADEAARERAIDAVARAAPTLLGGGWPAVERRRPARPVAPRLRAHLFGRAARRADRARRLGRRCSIRERYRALQRRRRWPPLERRGKAERAGAGGGSRARRCRSLRLAKASATFAGGADYIAWKINRHAGTEIELKPWQRRWPLLAAISLLPRLLRSGAVR